ncbi:DUF4253 domain-containing protein [Micromonospora sp. CPCC 205561]|uniref:DUF4253 domain-containing protein n=1 Tax=Micromonospora sp. CPCC 205561 TaxID=3122407 RepID=UPI002FF22AC9
MTEPDRPAAVRRLLTSVGIDATTLAAAVTADGLPVYGVRVETARAAELWRRLRARHGRTGLLPFLSREGPADWALSGEGAPRDPDRLAAALARPPAEVVNELITAQRAGSSEYTIPDQETTAYHLGLFDVAHTRELMDADPAEGPWRRHSEFGGVSRDPRWLCLVPARASFELPVLLDAPHASDWHASRAHPRLTEADHVGVLRSWQERFGAEIRYLGPVALGLVVAEPPTRPAELARVAVEQFAYCDDLDQFIGEPHRVAQLQVPTDRWYFWWD